MKLPIALKTSFSFLLFLFIHQFSYAQCPNLIENGDFTQSQTNWLYSYPNNPASGPIFFQNNYLEIWVDNDGNLLPGNILLTTANSFNLTKDETYTFSVNMKRTNDIISACNFSWALLDQSNTIVLKLGGVYTTGGNNALGTATEIPLNIDTKYQTCFKFNSNSGTYKLALVWESFEDGLARDVIIDDISLIQISNKINPGTYPNCFEKPFAISIPSCYPTNSISWTGPGIVSGQGTTSLTIDQPGTYSVSISNPAYNCLVTDNISINFSFKPKLQLKSIVPQNCSPLSAVNVEATGGTLAYTFTWQNSTPNGSTVLLAAGTYTATVTDSKSCTDTLSVIIPDSPFIGNAELIIPTIFSPNNDQVNDVFIPHKMENIEALHLNVYDRWGIQVYDSHELKFSWDGTDKQGNNCHAGTYFYIAEYDAVCGVNSHEKVKGTITLIR